MSLDLSLLSTILSLGTGGIVPVDLLTLIQNYKGNSKNEIKELESKLNDLKLSKSLTNKETYKRIADSFSKGQLVLVLGAGVSLDCGLPTWTTLLQKLIIKTIDTGNKEDKNRNRIAAQLFDSVFGPNPLIAARYLCNHFRELEKKEKKENLFEFAIRESLYDNYDSTKDSSLLQELVKLCVIRGTAKRISSVITYNYDDLLEQNINKRYMDFEYKSIYKIGDNPHIDDLPIYHVHGFLPKNGDLTTENRVTLSDNLYHSQYLDTYGWSNLVQVNNFKDKTCLFVGVSFTDPNQRRLLDIAKDQRGNDSIQHFMIKRKYKSKEIEDVITKILKVNDHILDEKRDANLGLADLSKFLVDLVHKFESIDANSFGVEIIWVDEYTDIPKVLDEIRKKSKE